MAPYTRYAVYYTPEADSDLARLGAAWLGWDTQAGTTAAHPDLAGLPLPLADITTTPRKYGLHGTLKPPFKLADEQTEQALADALAAFCAGRAPVLLDGLAVARLGGFLALTPLGDVAALSALASAVVTAFEPFRAPLTDAQLAKRRAAGLSDRQEALLTRWGYPYVMEEFRFHLTLSGKLGAGADRVAEVAQAYFRPALPTPYPVTGLSLCGEDTDGRFHVIHRYTLSG